MTPDLLLAVDKAAHANAYVGIGAGLCVMLTAVGLPTWRAFRRASGERAHQTSLTTDIHGAIYGTPEKFENGVKTADATMGLRDELAEVKRQLNEGSAPMKELKATLDEQNAQNKLQHEENTARLDRHEQDIADVKRVAGSAAIQAAAAKDRIEFLSGRWWERMEGLDLRNQFLTSVAQEQGYDVGTMPPIDEDDDGPPDVHGS